MMSVLTRDVEENLLTTIPATSENRYVISRDVLYADDTLLVSSDKASMEKHLMLITEAGKGYGLELRRKLCYLASDRPRPASML